MESVDTRDLKSLARMSMRVRVPPVLPTTGHKDYYDEPKDTLKLDYHEEEEELVIYNRHGKLVKLAYSR